ALLSNGLLLVIETLKDLANFASKVAKEVGVLPPIFLGLFLVLNKMGYFNKFKQSIIDVVTQINMYRTAMATATTAGTSRLGAIKAGWQGISTATTTATGATRAWSLSLKSAMIGTGIGAVLVGIGFLIEGLVSKFAEAKQKAEDLAK